METTLTKLGLNKKEARFYTLLLKFQSRTPAELSKETGETRVNCYALLDALVRKGLAQKTEVDKKFEYSAENPSKLKTLLTKMQNSLLEAETELKAILPNLTADYRIVQNKPGVIYLGGVESFRTIYEDILRTKSDIAIIPTRSKREITGLQDVVEEYRRKFKKAGIITRTLYRERVRKDVDMKARLKLGIHIRFWEAEQSEAQIIIYGDNVIVSTFTDNVFSTVVTDKIIARTMLTIFDEAWRNAKD